MEAISRCGAIIILEGNISAGKSTICNALKNVLPNAKAFLEPTATNPYLEKFYADPPSYALKMQLWLLRQRYHIYLDALRYVTSTGNFAILDRSVYSDWVFAEKNRIDKNISPEGYRYYMELRHHLLQDLPLPHFTIFLDVSPQTCYDRIHQLRQRNCESSIPLEYLEGLDDCYRRLLGELQGKGSQVLSFDWNNFGSPEMIAKGLNILSMSSMDEAQHQRVMNLLSKLEQKDAVEHLWPRHLSVPASLFEEREYEHNCSISEDDYLEYEKSRNISQVKSNLGSRRIQIPETKVFS